MRQWSIIVNKFFLLFSCHYLRIGIVANKNKGVKPIYIRMDAALWKRFKEQAKANGIRLEAAVDELFRGAVAKKELA